MFKNKKLSLVSLDQIPLAEPVPINNPNDLLDIFRVITQMERICTENSGIGLSAAQVGIPWQLFIIRQDEAYEYYLNCGYIGLGEKAKSIEGCLSLKDEQGNLRRFEVERYSEISFIGYQLKISELSTLILEKISTNEKDLRAIVFQHEIDHFSKREKMIDQIGDEIRLLC